VASYCLAGWEETWRPGIGEGLGPSVVESSMGWLLRFSPYRVGSKVFSKIQVTLCLKDANTLGRGHMIKGLFNFFFIVECSPPGL
jgi:hypothetical protein